MNWFARTLAFIVPVTGGLLLYVHGQIATLHVSYDLDLHGQVLEERREEHRQLRFEIDQLKAPRNLEERMKALDLNLGLPQEIKVIRVSRKTEVPAAPVTRPPQPDAFSEGLMQFLGRWVRVAQAKTDG